MLNFFSTSFSKRCHRYMKTSLRRSRGTTVQASIFNLITSVQRKNLDSESLINIWNKFKIIFKMPRRKWILLIVFLELFLTVDRSSLYLQREVLECPFSSACNPNNELFYFLFSYCPSDSITVTHTKKSKQNQFWSFLTIFYIWRHISFIQQWK